MGDSTKYRDLESILRVTGAKGIVEVMMAPNMIQIDLGDGDDMALWIDPVEMMILSVDAEAGRTLEVHTNPLSFMTHVCWLNNPSSLDGVPSWRAIGPVNGLAVLMAQHHVLPILFDEVEA